MLKNVPVCQNNFLISTCVEKFKIVTGNAISEYEPPAKRICNEQTTKSYFSLLYENQIHITTNFSHQNEIEQEIKNYESVAIQVDDKSNPLEFYRDNEILFKNLSQMAKMLFSITASSVASEGSFSNASDIISDLRNRLTTQHAEECLILSQNNRFEN